MYFVSLKFKRNKTDFKYWVFGMEFQEITIFNWVNQAKTIYSEDENENLNVF